MMKKYKKYLLAIPVAVIVLYAVFGGKSSGSFTSVPVVKSDVIETVNVTGKVAPLEKTDLAFEKGGLVSTIDVQVGSMVKKGTILGTIDGGEASAALKSSEANVLSEQARLSELLRGTRTEELNLAEQSYKNSKRKLDNTARDIFVKIDEAVRIKTDIMFRNGSSVVPEITIRTQSDTQKINVEAQRLKVTDILSNWKNNSDLVAYAVSSVEITKNFLDTLSAILADSINSVSAGVPTATVDQYRSVLNDALASINTANSSLISAESAYEAARDEYALKQAGATQESIAAQTAKVEQAQASALNLSAALRKTVIVAPIDGVVTTVNPKIGEVIPAGKTAFTVMSAGAFKIEVNVPEADIAKINTGNKAIITLDAYGESVAFSALVTLIDPAETILEGIPTYKVTLSIDPDTRIRSGMTANINLVTREKKDVIAVPIRAIIEKDGKKYVRKVTGKKYTEVIVETGLKGSNGTTEIINGLRIGDSVVTIIK